MREAAKQLRRKLVSLEGRKGKKDKTRDKMKGKKRKKKGEEKERRMERGRK